MDVELMGQVVKGGPQGAVTDEDQPDWTVFHLIGQPGKGMQESVEPLVGVEAAKAEDDAGMERDAVLLPQQGQLGRWDGLGRVHEIANVADAVRWQAVLTEVGADALCIADPGMGMAITVETVIPTEPGQMDGAPASGQTGKSGGTSEVGLHHIEWPGQNSDPPAGPQVPESEHGNVVTGDLPCQRLIDLATAHSKHGYGETTSVQGVDQADEESLGTSEFPAADDVQAAWIRHGLLVCLDGWNWRRGRALYGSAPRTTVRGRVWPCRAMVSVCVRGGWSGGRGLGGMVSCRWPEGPALRRGFGWTEMVACQATAALAAVLVIQS